MRIAPPCQSLPAYVRPEPVSVLPLSPEASKALIDGGVFDRGAHNLYAASTHTVANPYSAPYLSSKPDSPLVALRQAAEQAAPFFEQAQSPAADAMAVFIDGPRVADALANRNIGNAEKVVVLGSNAIRLLKLGNEFVQIPHLGPALEISAMIFKFGDQVFVSDEEKPISVP